ncbi:MAG: CsbD family protein [Methylobacter sp.]|nr:CsbD family protein [Methylobacter sp.]MDP2428222.1 CsbD family protein [Methylobacter sp.]MDP3055194.1 CsbD family protein [Methylobacter sp.]MDP3364270.1 CsbD family protein [Methylobacter sp.]MDZ4220652.1 CsbD family protein [Methylobacter sp.]
MKQIISLLAVVALASSAFGVYAGENKDEAPLNINKDQIEGRVDETKGAIKELTGKVLDDKGMEIEGNIEKNVGKAQAGFGDLKKDAKDLQEGK